MCHLIVRQQTWQKIINSVVAAGLEMWIANAISKPGLSQASSAGPLCWRWPSAGFVLASSPVDHGIGFVDPHLQVIEIQLWLHRTRHALSPRY
ncbi:MAG: hypothetical protein WB919_16975 [Candidatus Sulfotelmatobacter sp.]